MEITTSAFSTASAGVASTRPTPSASARLRVRFQSVSSWPSDLSLFAIAPPIFPVPRIATRITASFVNRLSLLLGLRAFFPVLDDVAFLKQHLFEHGAPLRFAPREEFQRHGEVLELLLLRVAHDRLGLGVALE